MLNIIICEDEPYQWKKLKEIIIELKNTEDYEFKIELSTKNPSSVIEYLQNNKEYKNIYFIDIDLNCKINGLDLAKEIRKYDIYGEIIFITSHLEYSFLTFEYKVSALDYIIKQDYEKMKNRINDCFKEIKKRQNILNIQMKDTIYIDSGGNIINIKFDDILFIETSGVRKIRIHTLNEYIETYGTLKEIQKELNDKFYRVHRSYIINIEKIKMVDKVNRMVHIINDEKCYVAARFMKELLKRCQEY